MTQHTPAPWQIGFGDGSGPTYIVKPDSSKATGYDIIVSGATDDWNCPQGVINPANAARIVACVNACEGLSTAALMTAGERPVLKLIEAAAETTTYDEQRDAGEGALFEAVRALEEEPGT